MKTQTLLLEDIYAPIESHLLAVEQKVLDLLKTPNALSSEVIGYFLKAKGKFLRPALCLFGASFGEGVTPAVIQNAAALEIFHSATLIHDDIIDSAHLRRNIPTINVVWNPQVAVLIGDYLQDRVVAAIFELHNERATSLFLETAGVVCDGEILELGEKSNFSLREDQYFTIIERKTAALLSCCLEMGAILSNVPADQAQVLKRFGTYFGIAFQVVDDCLDFRGKENELGKTLGADCAAGILTLPLIRLLSLADEKKKSEICQMIQSGFSGENLPKLVRYLEQYEALDYAFRKAKEYAERARLELSVLKDYPVKRSLHLLLDYVLERNR